MISRVDSFVLQGIDAVPCEVEVALTAAELARTTVVGLPDAAVRESIDRVRTAIVNAGFRYPYARITVNLAPADIRKEGPVFDLPIALAMLHANRTIAPAAAVDGVHGPDDADDAGGAGEARAAGGHRTRPSVREFLVAGELALDGRVRPVRGVVSLAMLARAMGRRGVIVPLGNAREAAVVEGIEVYAAARIEEVVAFLNGVHDIAPTPGVDTGAAIARAVAPVDLGEVRGQEAAKRAITIAAAGGHNVLMIGPAGTGKSMMAKALPGVLPPLTPAEALEVTRIYSSAGLALARGDHPLVLTRPVRAPHHTASAAAIIGGGTVPRPGDVTLAHRGVLFLDEMPEFSRAVLETLRQPLEDGCVTIARARGSVCFPARFMLVAALNPTAQGDAGSDAASRRAMEQYLSRLSGPLIDRIDIHVEVPAVPFRALTAPRGGTDSATVRERVVAARAVQHRRQGPLTNAELRGKVLDRCAALPESARTLLGQALTELGLSARAYDKIRRVARTIADLEGREGVETHHVAEAVQYRLLDRMPGGRGAAG